MGDNHEQTDQYQTSNQIASHNLRWTQITSQFFAHFKHIPLLAEFTPLCSGDYSALSSRFLHPILLQLSLGMSQRSPLGSVRCVPVKSLTDPPRIQSSSPLISSTETVSLLSFNNVSKVARSPRFAVLATTAYARGLLIVLDGRRVGRIENLTEFANARSL